MSLPEFIDVQIDGSWVRLRRDEDSFQLTSQRSKAPVTTAPMSSRPERPMFFQTSWVDGAAWWRPTMSEENRQSYFDATNMDCLETPGRVTPRSRATRGVEANLYVAHGLTYADGPVVLGATTLTDGTYRDIYERAGGSWSRDATVTAGLTSPVDMAYDPSDGWVYVAGTTAIARFNRATNTVNANWITGAPNGDGLVSIAKHYATGLMMVYDGERLVSIDKTTPGVNTIFNPGLGSDFITEMAAPSNRLLRLENLRFMVTAPSGVYLLRNEERNGTPECVVYRVERDAAGNWTGYQIADPIVGFIGTSIFYHLGSVMILGSHDWRRLLDNDSSKPWVSTLYHVTGSSIGAVGRPVGDGETVGQIVGSLDSRLLLSSPTTLWAYDAIRGGIHPLLDYDAAVYPIPSALFQAPDSSSRLETLVLGSQEWVRWLPPPYDYELATVANFGDDLTTYTLTSNPIDFGLPHETKTVVEVELTVDGSIDANQRWTLQLRADGGAWTTVLTSSQAFASASGLSVSGREIEYRLIYETKSASTKPAEVRSLGLHAHVGTMVRRMRLLVDGSDLQNVTNAPVDPEEVYDFFVNLMSNASPLLVRNNFQSYDQADWAETATPWLIEAVVIAKQNPNESSVQVQLVEA